MAASIAGVFWRAVRPRPYTVSLLKLERFKEASSLLRRMIPVTQRILKGSHELTLRMRGLYADVLYKDPSATLEDLREAVTTLEETERTMRRVFGGAHPTTVNIERGLRNARAALRAREGAVSYTHLTLPTTPYV